MVVTRKKDYGPLEPVLFTLQFAWIGTPHLKWIQIQSSKSFEDYPEYSAYYVKTYCKIWNAKPNLLL